MTFADFLVQLRRELEEPSEGVWADASFLVWTNQAARDLAKRTKCKRDEQYADALVGSQTYEMPEYTLEPIAVFFNGRKLRREDFNNWASLAHFETSGTPTTFAVSDNMLMLWPVPDSVGEIRYFRYRYPDPIEEDGDLPFDGEYDDLLAFFVKAKAHEQINDWQSAVELRRMYYEGVDMVGGQKNMERQALMQSSAPREVY